MALVSRIIGDCPGCGLTDTYGNINVSGNTLALGCMSCRYRVRVPLPDLDKKIIYLDQYFYSHAFRGGNLAFQSAKDKLQQLAYKQLLVAPYSQIHEDETQLWTPDQRAPLLKFIKQTSAGHDFRPEHWVKETQLHRAFQAFVRNEDPAHQVQRDDALPRDINDWDDYVWIDVTRPREDAAALRNAKEQSANALLDLFPRWAEGSSTFDEDVRAELKSLSQSYINLYAQYMKRLISFDFNAVFDSPTDSQIVEALMRQEERNLSGTVRMQRIRAFFDSEHFANIPVERISSEFFALLRGLVNKGAFRSRDKAMKRLKGVFYDVRFISTYAPYCDAMVVDTAMHRWATDPLIDLPRRFGTRFYSRANWQDFLRYLDEIETGISPEVQHALTLKHPPNAKAPDWKAMLGKKR